MNLTTEQLAAVAERLRWPLFSWNETDLRFEYAQPQIAPSAVAIFSEGDLLLAILKCVAELGRSGDVLYALETEAGVAAAEKRAPDYLSAVILAFIQLPVPT